MLSSVKRGVNFFLNKISNSTFGNFPFISGRRNASTNIKEQKIKINGLHINYLKVGRGAHPVLLLPGALGSIWTDFKPQITNLDKDKFTIVAWDPPGYGNSRPPNRTFGEEFVDKDASIAHAFMNAIGHEKFSVFGWSCSSITAFFLAANYPKSVQKMIVLGACSYILPEEIKTYKSLRNIDSWSERMRAPMIALYGEGYFRSTWASWVDAISEIYEKNKGNICMNRLRDIKCETLIVHGEKDAIVHADHSKFLHENIKNSKLKIFHQVGHNAHLRYHQEFNDLLTQFLLDN